jgi:hypothetical protein
MKKLLMTGALALVGGLILGSAQAASAQTAFVPLSNSYTALGRFSGSNQTYLVSFQPSTGLCLRAALGGAAGLPAGTSQVWGTNTSEFIGIIDVPNTGWCGTWGLMQPPTRNASNWIKINMLGDVDLIDGKNHPRLQLGGDDGADILMSNGTTANVELYGFNGNDTFYTGTNAKVFGENDADHVCVHSGQTVAQYWGGFGADTYCGSVAFVNSASASCPCL